MKNKKIILVLILVILLILIILAFLFFLKKNSSKDSSFDYPDYQDSNLNVVPSLEDPITDNSIWCGTINLIWNDLKNDLVKQDIIFENQTSIITNLNKGTFTTSELSSDSYYKVYGHPTFTLKDTIAKNIQEKFNETSTILDSFTWSSEDSESYFLYAMLKKEFQFPNAFTELENSSFNDTPDVSYFGVDSTTSSDVYSQIEVLYYENESDFAISLLTSGNDQIIISRGLNEETFLETYEKIKEKSSTYEGLTTFTENDYLKIPNLTISLKKEFSELENQTFKTSTGNDYFISKILQTISFSLDKTGGQIKSEAGMSAWNISASAEEERYFFVIGKFNLFLIEKGSTYPYLALRLSDINIVQ